MERTYHPLPGGGFITRRRGECRPVEPDASRGARPVRRRLARPKAAREVTERRQPGRSIRWRYPQERGRQGHAFERRPWWHEAGENPVRGARAETARATRLAWGLPISAMRTDRAEYPRPGDRPRKGGREELNHERRKLKRLPVRPDGDGAGPRTAHLDGYPGASAFCSGKTWVLAKDQRRLCRGDSPDIRGGRAVTDC